MTQPEVVQHAVQIGMGMVPGPDKKQWGNITFMPSPTCSIAFIFPADALDQMAESFPAALSDLAAQVKRANMGLVITTDMPPIKKRI
jgi:hypothetical protein